MSASQPIVLFDIPGKDADHKALSPSCWKARYTLNYKGLAYNTEWVEFPDIAAVVKKYGGAPTGKNPDDSPLYTLPMIYDPSTRTAVTDSADIARYLDKTYPNTPQLFPTGTIAFQAAFLDAVTPSVLVPLFFVIAARFCEGLNPRSREYIRTTREAAFGAKLEQLGGETQWKALEEGLGKVAGWLAANGEGKDQLFLGDKVTFSDIQLVAILKWGQVSVGVDSADWQRIASWNGGKWAKLVEFFKQHAAIDA